MRRAFAFSGRNFKELLRDPLSYIFCLGFPLVMFFVMSAINSIIPAEAGMTLFEPASLTPGIAVFALSFVMLFSTLSVSKDRSGAFLIRLFSSPMTAFDFIVGYTLPLIAVAAGQITVTYLTGAVFALVSGTPFGFVPALISALSLLICAVLFIGLGMIFGTLFSEKAAPPCSSIIISACGIVGGIWFDVSTIPEGNFFGTVCGILPFSHAVTLGRRLLAGNYGGNAVHVINVLIWALALLATAIVVFGIRMKKDNK